MLTFLKTKRYYDVRFNALEFHFPEHYERVVDALSKTYELQLVNGDPRDPQYINPVTDDVLALWHRGISIDEATQQIIDKLA